MNMYHEMKRATMTDSQKTIYDQVMKMEKETIAIDVTMLAQTNQTLRQRILKAWKVMELMQEQIVASEGQYTAEIIAHYHQLLGESLAWTPDTAIEDFEGEQ